MSSLTTSRPSELGSPWSDLDALVAGSLTTPGDAGWSKARMPWLVNVDQQPAAVLECADADDVCTAVRWAARHGRAVSVQPRGHAARRALDDTLLLRTGALSELAVDAEHGSVRVGAGVRTEELLAALDGTGLVALVGSNPDPSVVGLALGGGASWFSRKHGFTANSVLSLDVVDPEGALVRVDADHDPELFWALRGGGGDFGIVVAAELRLFAEPELVGGQLVWPVEHAAVVLRAFREVAAQAPPELTLWAQLQHFPPLPELPDGLRGRSFVSVAVTFLGTDEEAARLLQPLRASAPVETDSFGGLRISELGSVTGEPTEPMPALEHTMTLHQLDERAIDQLVEVASDPRTCPLAVVQLRHLGGAFADRPAAGGAVSPVSAEFNLWALGVPAVPELAHAIPVAFEAVEAAVAHQVTGRRLPNFTGCAQDDAAGYDDDALDRLRRLKQERDPHGVIRSNKPVLGRSAGGRA